MTVTLVDARGLLPPEPMERTLAALDDIHDTEDEVLLLLYREPLPLYQVLQRNGYCHATEADLDGTFRIHIRRAG